MKFITCALLFLLSGCHHKLYLEEKDNIIQQLSLINHSDELMELIDEYNFRIEHSINKSKSVRPINSHLTVITKNNIIQVNNSSKAQYIETESLKNSIKVLFYNNEGFIQDNTSSNIDICLILDYQKMYYFNLQDNRYYKIDY